MSRSLKERIDDFASTSGERVKLRPRTYASKLDESKRKYRNDQSGGTDTAGGNTIEKYTGEAIRTLERAGVFRQHCHVVGIDSLVANYPYYATHPTVEEIGEAAPVNVNDVTFGNRGPLTTRKQVSRMQFTTELLEDSATDLLRASLIEMANALAYSEDEAIAAVIEAGLGAGGKVSVANAGAAVLADLIAVLVKVSVMSNETRSWFMHPSTYATFLALEGAVGSVGDSLTILGQPCQLVPAMKPSSSATSGDLLAIYGNLDPAVVFGDRGSEFDILDQVQGAGLSVDAVDLIGKNRFSCAVIDDTGVSFSGLVVT